MPKTTVDDILAKKAMYGEVGKKIFNACNMLKETLYRPQQLIKALGLDVSARGLTSSISGRYKEFGLIRILHKEDANTFYKAHYGVSDICGSRECFKGWCDTERCPTGNGNEKLRIVEWDEKFK